MKRKIIPLLVILVLAGLMIKAQDSEPQVAVRFWNPLYDCVNKTYCLDVQFQSDTPGQQLFGMNLRFYYADNLLEYLGAYDFKPGYGLNGTTDILTGPGEAFGFTGQADYVNGSVQLLNQSVTLLPTDDWLTLFTVCFHVDDPNSLNIDTFCPSIVWDLQENYQEETGGGFQPGSDGVVMTVVDPAPNADSAPTIEIVVQHNWVYGNNPNGFGHPSDILCISTVCGYVIPVSNWALFLGISLMVIATIVVYRRRMN